MYAIYGKTRTYLIYCLYLKRSSMNMYDTCSNTIAKFTFFFLYNLICTTYCISYVQHHPHEICFGKFLWHFTMFLHSSTDAMYTHRWRHTVESLHQYKSVCGALSEWVDIGNRLVGMFLSFFIVTCAIRRLS